MSRPNGSFAKQVARRTQPRPRLRQFLAEAIREHQAGHSENAQRLYLDVLAMDAKQATALYGLGLLQHQLGRYEAAARMMERAIAVDGRVVAYHFNLGETLLAQSKFDAAAEAYERALRLDPENEDVHFALGNARLQQGQLNEARTHYENALRLKPDRADTHSNLGNVFLKTEQLEEAHACYERALALDPGLTEAQNNLGNVYLKQEKLAEAVEQYTRALALDPNKAETHNNLGNALRGQGKPEEARASFERAVDLNPRDGGAWNNLASALHGLGELQKAAECYQRALALTPDCGEAHNNLGTVLQELGRPEEAVACHRRALEVNPQDAGAWSNLGVALGDLDRLQEAAECLLRALALRPDYAEAHNNLGVVYRKEGKLQEAGACHERALALRPEFSGAENNLGNVRHSQGRLTEARACYERALAIQPESVDGAWNRSLLDLLEGNYAAGWSGYEARKGLKKVAPRTFPEPQWQGESLDGARILLHSEQGLGDTLQFLRYVPLVQARGGAVALDVPPVLRRLAAQLPGLDGLTARGEPLGSFAWHCPLMSLPLAFGTTVDTIPARVPYLAAPEEARQRASEWSWPEKGLRVAVVWSGNPQHSNDRVRSVPLSMLAPILDVEGVHYFSLQMGAAAERLSELSAKVSDLRPAIGDMADTAALLEHLDLVITVDTAVAHLAGALGRPVWVLLPSTPDWRWLTEREDSPWYPTARLFRQPRPGDWQAVMERVRTELTAMTPMRGSHD